MRNNQEIAIGFLVAFSLAPVTLAQQTQTPPKKAVKAFDPTAFTMPKAGATYTVAQAVEVLAKDTISLTILHHKEKEEYGQTFKVMLDKGDVILLDIDTVVRVVLIRPDSLSPKIKHLFVEVQSGEYEGRKGWMSPCGVLTMNNGWIACTLNEGTNWKPIPN